MGIYISVDLIGALLPFNKILVETRDPSYFIISFKYPVYTVCQYQYHLTWLMTEKI